MPFNHSLNSLMQKNALRFCRDAFRSVQLAKRTLKHSSPNFKKKNYLLSQCVDFMVGKD